MLSRHMDNILTYCRHRITNGSAEGLNSKIMAIKRRACGYRNREHFKPSSTSSAAAWTSIQRMPERLYPRKNRKDPAKEPQNREFGQGEAQRGRPLEKHKALYATASWVFFIFAKGDWLTQCLINSLRI